MSDKLVLIKGVQVPEGVLFAALNGLHYKGFLKDELQQALIREGLTEVNNRDFTRRVLQHLRQGGLIRYEQDEKLWHVTGLGQAHLPLQTLPLIEATQPATTPASTPTIDRLSTIAHGTLSAFACIALIVALITLNASFAWELGREAGHFRFAFVIGLMGLDLMRPFLVAAGFAFAASGRGAVAVTAFAVGLALSPVSVLSSTAILSSSVLLGAEMNTDETTRAATLETLRTEHARKLTEVERLQAAWVAECARGGCGPIAEGLEAEFTGLADDAQAILDRIVALTETSSGASDLLARMVMTFEQLGLFGADRQIWLPLFLALSLELGALFGPALLLRHHIKPPGGLHVQQRYPT